MENADLIRVDYDRIRKSAIHFKREYLDRPNYNLEGMLKIHDDGSGMKPISKNAEDVKASIESFFGSCKAIKETISEKKVIFGNGNLSRYLDIYSVHMAAKAGLENLSSMPGEEGSISSQERIDFRSGTYNTTMALAKAYKGVLAPLNGSSTVLLGATKTFYKWIADQTQQELEADEFKDYTQKMKKVELEINGRVIATKIENNKISSNASSTTNYGDIIGNDIAKKKCEEIASVIGCYDTSIRKNPETEDMGSPYVVLLFGPPGNGKSTILSAIENDLAKSASDKGIEYQRINIDNSLIKDKYHGEGPKRFKEAFERAKDPNKMTLVMLDDVDGILQNRDAHDASHAENEVLNVALNQIDGVDKDYRGNYLVVMTTNKTDKIDDALKSRTMISLEVKGPESIEDYVKFIDKQLIPKHKENVQIDRAGIKKIAEKCHEHGFSGRNMKKYLENITSEIRGGVIPREIRNMQGAELRNALKTRRKNVDLETMLKVLEVYSNGKR